MRGMRLWVPTGGAADGPRGAGEGPTTATGRRTADIRTRSPIGSGGATRPSQCACRVAAVALIGQPDGPRISLSADPPAPPGAAPHRHEVKSGDESEQGAVGEGRLHPHRREHARERRGAGRRTRRSRGLEVLDLGCGDGTTALPAARLGADVLGVDIARTSSRPGTARAQEEGLTNCRFQEGDASEPARPRRRHLRPRRQHLRRDVRAASRSTSRRRWCASRGPADGSSWATGSPTIRRSSRRS